MDVRPSILCPIDFSDASAGALRYAAAIASHFGTRLIVLTVEDPLLTEAAIWAPGSAGTPSTASGRWPIHGPHVRPAVAAAGRARI